MKRPTTLANAMAQIDGAFIPEPLEQSAIKVLQEAMEANCFVRGPDLGKDGQRQYVEVPDHAIRVLAAVRVIEWRRGKPAAQLTINTLPPRVSEQVRTAELMRLVAEHPEIVDRFFASVVAHAKSVVPIDAGSGKNGTDSSGAEPGGN